MCKKVAEVVRVQCGREYFPEDEQDPRAVQLYAMTDEGRKNIPTENLVTERYLAKFGYLASLSASRSNKNFKAKQIPDDLILSSVEIDVKVLKKTESIIKDLQSMKVMWTESKDISGKERKSKNVKKKQPMNDEIDILLKNAGIMVK